MDKKSILSAGKGLIEERVDLELVKLTSDVEYVLNLLSKISDDNSVESADNGLSQSVEVRKGISLKANETIRPIVALTPFRTFLEVEQPESDFLLRVREGGQIGLMGADGGMWKLTAKKSIKDYFAENLEELITARQVIVIG